MPGIPTDVVQHYGERTIHFTLHIVKSPSVSRFDDTTVAVKRYEYHSHIYLSYRAKP